MAMLLTNNRHTWPMRSEGMFDRLFNDVFENFWQPGWANDTYMDVYDNGHEYLIEEAVPGMNKKDLRLTVDHDGRLILEGQKAISKNRRGAGYEYESAVHKSYLLPDDADIDKIKAHVKDGLMRISIAKTSSPADAKSITISSEEENEKGPLSLTAPKMNLKEKLKRWFK